jgi:hypothetical protein
MPGRNFRWGLAGLVNIFLVEINWIPSEEDKVRLADGPFIRKIDLSKPKQNGKMADDQGDYSKRSWDGAKIHNTNSFSSRQSDLSAQMGKEKKGGYNDWEKSANPKEREKNRLARENKENVEAIKSLNCYNDWVKKKMIEEMKIMPKANPT